jgi:glucan phosphoethanolaminetransferase (alkaline phosphatase superfamily)
MPQKRNSQEPPEVMTWGKATPVLVVCVIFDALRFMFEWFIFFGPALAGLICTVAAGNTSVGSAVGTAVTGSVCATGAALAGVAGVEVTAPLGVVMAMATGLAGWLTVGIILIIFNGRIFKENALWFAASLLVSEVPFIGSIPAITLIVWRMYSNQIRIEKAAMKAYEASRAAEQLQQRQQQEAQLMQTRAAQVAQTQEQEAANDEMYSQVEAANDEQYIPDKMDRAA